MNDSRKLLSDMNKTLVLALVFIATSAGVHAKPVAVFILVG